MRKVKCYTLYDEVAEMHSEFMFKATNEEDAKRAFAGFLDNSPVRPKDLTLFEIGEYDRWNGTMKGYDIPKRVIWGHDLLNKPEEEEVKSDDTN